MTFITRDRDRNDTEEQMRSLLEVATITRRIYQRGGTEGLEANALQVLIAVQLMVQPTVGELVDELALGQGTVSTALARLQQRGLVTALTDPTDARRQRQRIAQSGRALVKRFLRVARQRVEESWADA
jgi:DNA-binding MarR family transcriptional regulator